MGWEFTPGASRADIVADRIQPWIAKSASGTCLAHQLDFEEDTYVLWTVWEITQRGRPSRRVVRCDVLHEDPRLGWGFKEVAEEEDPRFYSCPLSFLEMTPAANPAWRVLVREHHEDWARRMKDESDRLRKLAHGSQELEG